MGELRNSILELQKQIATAAKSETELAKQLEDDVQRCVKTMQTLEAGADDLWLYLNAMFDKNNRKIAEYMKDKLSEHADSEIVGFLKGIDQAANDVTRSINDFHKTKGSVPAAYAKIDQQATLIRRNIAKKRDKLFKSKTYKAKLTGYEAALDQLLASTAGRRNALQDQDTLNQKGVDALRLKPSATLQQVKDICTRSVDQELDRMRKEVQKGTWVSRKFHENGDMKQAFELMKKWAADADAMDKEVLAMDPNAAKPLTNVVIKSGSKVLAKAPKATYQGKRPMQVPDVKWEKGVDFTHYLQAKVTITGKSADGGAFATDMKINGVQGGTIIKLT